MYWLNVILKITSILALICIVVDFFQRRKNKKDKKD